MRKFLTITAAIVVFFFVSAFNVQDLIDTFIPSPKQERPTGNTPERIFNMATEAMVKGDDAVAIELYYKLVEDYPAFKKYRKDILYRLGNLLYKTERYEEAERIYRTLSTKYKNYKK